MANTVRDRYARLQSLAQNVAANLTEMPDLAANHTAFEQLVNRIRDSLAEQDAISARLSQLIGARREDMKLATEMRLRLAGQIQGHLGTANERLKEFGIKPRRQRLRRKGTTPAPEEPAPESPAVRRAEPSGSIQKEPLGSRQEEPAGS